MTEQSHTPGPWKPVESHTGDWYIAQANDDGAIGEVYADAGGSEDAEANARLIAAAPELLEAAKEIVRTGLGDEAMHGDQREAVALIIAAIAKATGGSV